MADEIDVLLERVEDEGLRRTDGTFAASIVDPHGGHLADARNKLNALADYAERYGENFVRIHSITKNGDELLPRPR